MKNFLLIIALALASAVNAQTNQFAVQFTGLNESCITDSMVDRIEITYQNIGDNNLNVIPAATVILGDVYNLEPSIGCDYIMVKSIDALDNTLSVKIVMPQNLIAGSTNVISVY